MRILHVTPSYFPAVTFGGPVKSVHLLNKSLVENNVEVDVFTTNAGIKSEDQIKLKEWHKIDGVNVKYFPYNGYIHYNFSLSLFRELLGAVGKYDLVHITAVWNFPVLAAVIACKKNNIPYIISPRGTIYPETIELKSKLIKNIYLTLFGRYCLNNAAAIHYTSFDEQQKVSGSLRLKAPSKIIMNGLDLSNDLVNIENDDIILLFSKSKYILFMGRLTKKKGLDILIDAYSEVVKVYPDVKLIIAGPDNENYKKELIKRCNKYGIGNNVVFPGMLEGKVKEEAYKKALMFILPSYSENFGMTVAEAMSLKTPVIISDRVGIYYIVKEYNAGIVVRPNKEDLLDAIELLLNYKEKKEEITSNALRLVEKEFNIFNISRQFKDLYQSVIDN